MMKGWVRIDDEKEGEHLHSLSISMPEELLLIDVHDDGKVTVKRLKPPSKDFSLWIKMIEQTDKLKVLAHVLEQYAIELREKT